MPIKKRTLRFVVIGGSLVLFLALLLWLSLRGPLFARTYTLRAEFDSVSGLERQNKVLLRGYPIGRVQGISFEPDGIVVTMEIEGKYQVPGGSEAAVESYNLLGERAINLTPAGPGPALPPGSMVPGVNRDLMAEVRSALEGLRRSEQAFDPSRLARTLDLLEGTLGTLKGEIGRMDAGRMITQLGEAVKTAGEIRDAIRKGLASFGAMNEENRSMLTKLGLTLESAEKTQAALDRYLSRLEAAGSTSADLLSDAQFVANFKDVVAQLNDFLKDIKKNPKKYFRFSLF